MSEFGYITTAAALTRKGVSEKKVRMAEKGGRNSAGLYTTRKTLLGYRGIYMEMDIVTIYIRSTYGLPLFGEMSSRYRRV